MMRQRAIFGVICVLVALLRPAQMDLFVTANTFNLIGFIGKGVTMYTTVRGDPRPTDDNIVWLKVGSNLPDSRIEKTFDISTNESRLRINELEYSDAGVYYCVVTVNGVSKSVSMTLNVVVEPGVERITQLITSKGVGQSAVFSVSVSGNPLPTAQNITWAKLDQYGLPSVTSDSRWSTADGKKKMTISNLVISDEGWYKCLVWTDEGKADVTFNLYVLGMRSIEPTATGVVGNSARLTCTATYYQMLPSDPSIQWYRYSAPTIPLSGSTITRSLNDHAVSILTLNYLTWNNGGDYFCNSTYNGYPQDSIYNSTLHIRGLKFLSSEVNGVECNDAKLTCVVKGDQQPAITWSHSGQNVSTAAQTYTSPLTTSILTLTYLNVSDQGNYTCTVEFSNPTDVLVNVAELDLHTCSHSNGTAFSMSTATFILHITISTLGVGLFIIGPYIIYKLYNSISY